MKYLASIALLGFAALTPHITFAVGFDCRQASTSIEKAVCADNTLSRQDDELNKVYAQALKGLSRHAEDTMRTNQRSWLSFIKKLCVQNMGGSPLADADCLKEQYDNRLEALKLTKKQEPLTFYTHDTYLIKSDPKADNFNWWDMTTVTAAYPMIDGEPDLAFNKFSEESSVDTLANKKGTDHIRLVSVEKIYPHIIVLKRQFENRSHGAVTEGVPPRYAYYWRSQERGLRLNDVFESGGLANLIDNEFQKSDTRLNSLTAYRIAHSKNLEYFSINEDGIRMYDFDLSNKSGHSLFLTWKELQPYIKPDAEGLFKK